MSAERTLSVIVPSLGRAEALCDCVGDLLAQRTRPLEILVIHQQPDEASPSTRRLREWRCENAIRLFEPDFANAQRARNLGIREARGEILLLLDDDVRLGPDLVERHLSNYLADPSLDGVVGQVLLPGQESTLDLPSNCNWPHLGWQFFPLNYARRTPLQNWPSTNSSIRRRMAIEIGGFDEQFERTWLDDTDFSCRLAARGARLVFDPRASVTHLKVPRGGQRHTSRPALWMDCEGWATYFYFWRKNFGMWKARRAFWWQIRYLVLRKAVLIRPRWLIKNLRHMIQGYRLATAKLRQGPMYLSQKAEA